MTRRFGDHHEVSELEVYTLGVDEKWRNLGQIPYSFLLLRCGASSVEFTNKATLHESLNWNETLQNTHRGKNVCSFYAGSLLLWLEQDQNHRQNISKAGLKEVLEEQNKTRVVQFLMKLRPKFKPFHGSLLNREVTPALDVVLATVLREEIRLGTQAAMESTSLPSVTLLVGKSTIVASIENNKRSVNVMNANTLVMSQSGKLIQDSTVAALPKAISSELWASSSVNGHTLPTSGIGSAGYLSNVLYVPNLKANLISAVQLVDQNFVVKFSPNGCVIQNLKTEMIMATGQRFGIMFLLESVHCHLHHCFLSVSAAAVTLSNKLLTLWHNRMGHPHFSRLHQMLKSSHKRHKLSTKVGKCTFVGYSDTQKGYLGYDTSHHQLLISRHVILFEDQFSCKHNAKHASESLSFLYKFDDDVVATDPQLESSEQPMDYDNGDLQTSSPSSTDPLLESPKQPMKNGNDSLQTSYLSDIDFTSSFSSSKEGSSHLVTPPHRSSRINRHAPKQLGYSPGKFCKSYALHTTLYSVEVPTSYAQASTQTCWKEAISDKLCELNENSAREFVYKLADGVLIRSVLFHSNSPIHLKGYTDADWAGYPDSHHSITG
ncbi:hypothetical protein BC332_27904 [Capsicum chinense]|nr:hypothetical protein BC332_27904 [Capsicum chinense]